MIRVEGGLVDKDKVQRHVKVMVVEWAVQVTGQRASRERDRSFMAGKQQFARRD